MGDGNPWSRVQKQKRKMRREMLSDYEREYMQDDEERNDGRKEK